MNSWVLVKPAPINTVNTTVFLSITRSKDFEYAK